MSADNYYFVSKLEPSSTYPDGGYAVSHRFASSYYADEMGDSVPIEAYGMTGGSEGWSLDGDSKNEGKDVSEDMVVEYGVVVQEGLV